MATCFRGARYACFQPLRTFAFQRPTTTHSSLFATLRLFTSSTIRAASIKVRPPPPAKLKAYQSKAPWQRTLDQLADKNSESVLYRAPKQGAFRIVCYAAAFACFAASASSYKFFYSNLKDKKDRDGLASWVPMSFGVIAVFWACIGTWLAAAPISIVRSIVAIPKLGPQKSLALRIEIMRLPGMKDKVHYVAPHNCLTDGSVAATTAEYAVARQTVVDSRKPRPDDPLVLKPFLALGRWVSRSIYMLMIYTKMSVMREGFVKLRISNVAIAKIDCAGELEMGGLGKQFFHGHLRCID